MILIIGILAAIAIPAFLNQRGKAYDAAAKSQVKTAQTAMETYATDHNGTYTSNKSDLVAIEPTLGDTGTGSSLSAVTGNSTTGTRSRPRLLRRVMLSRSLTTWQRDSHLHHRQRWRQPGGCSGSTW